MSTQSTPTAAPKLSKRSTMAAVLDQVFQDESLPDKKRSNVRWAFRAYAKGVGRPLEELLADPRAITEQLDRLTAAMVDLTEGGWANATCLIRFALRHVGLIKPLAHRREPFAPAWTALLASMARKHDQIGLSRLARFCTVQGIDPDDVTDDVFASFLTEITEESVIRQPRKVHRRAAVIWNEMALTVRNWPTQTVKVPNYSRMYFLGWDRFPVTLQADVEAHLHSLDGTDLLANLGISPLKPGSIRTRRHQLGAYLSALVLKGEDPATLRTLADVVDERRVRLGLQFFLDRAPAKSRKQAYGIARVLLSIARHWIKAAEADITALQAFCKKLTEVTSMAPKVRTRLRQFDDGQAFFKLDALPAVLVTEAKQAGSKPTQADALLVQTAVAIEMLLMVPIRRGNLAGLDQREHIVRHRSGSVYLSIPGHLVKNGVDIEATLPAGLVKLIDLYIERYRPILDPDNSSSWLFPGLPGRHKSRERLALQVSDTIKERVGLVVNVHLFRAISAKRYLDRNPGGYGVVKHLHGHKSLETTIRSYCGLEGTSAIAHYDKVVLDARNTARSARKRRAA